MEIYTFLLFFITTVITVYFGWNFLSNRKNHLMDRDNDIRYYELKSKYEFLVAVVTVGALLLGFLGVTTYNEVKDNLKQNIQSQIKPSTDSLKLLSDGLNSLSEQVKTNNAFIEAAINRQQKLERNINRIDERALSSKKDIEVTEKKIKDIGSLDILNKAFYIVENFEMTFDMDERTNRQFSKPVKFSFKNLKTNKGESLPDFQKTPLILASGTNGGSLSIYDVTTKDFQATVLGFAPKWGDPNETGIYTFKFRLIFYY